MLTLNVSLDDELNDFNEFLKEFQGETDRGAALVGAALIDLRLKETLQAFFAETKVADDLLDGGDRPLGTFSARTKAAFCLGLIDPEEYHECNLIRKIRNAFAHRVHGTTFRDPEIAGYCVNLKLGFPIPPRVRKDEGRLLFTYSVFFVTLGLHNRSKRVAEEKRVIRPTRPVQRVDTLPQTPQNDG